MFKNLPVTSFCLAFIHTCNAYMCANYNSIVLFVFNLWFTFQNVLLWNTLSCVFLHLFEPIPVL